MALNQQLEDDNTVSELNDSSEDEPIRVSALIEKKLELIVIRTVRQLIGPILEPLIRKVVKEEIESAQETILTSLKRNEIHPSESRILQLSFLDKLSLPILTGTRIQGEGGISIRVALVDCSTGEFVKCGPEASAKVEIVVIQGDFDDGEGRDWTIEEFNQKIVREIEGKKSVLIGDAYLNMKEGGGTVGEISFTHNSRWMKNGEFKLGARMVDNFSGTRVIEAISESFILKDRRSTLNEKHYPPSLSDEVWRLKNIGKDGPFHKRLSKEKITTVKDFLTLFNMNPQRLHDIYVAGTKSAGTKMVDIMIDHARTCKLDETVYLYHPSSQQKNGMVFDVVGQLMGLLLECQYVPIDTLPETEKDDIHKLVVSAFEHREDFESFDNITSLMHACSQNHPSNSPRLENPSAHNGNNDMQPSTSSPGIFSYIPSIGDMNNMDDFGWLTNDNTEFTVEQLLSDPGEVPSSPGEYDEDWLFLNNPQPEKMAMELPDAEQSATSSSRLVCTPGNRWGMLFIMLLRVKIRRIVGSNHVRKKQRCC